MLCPFHLPPPRPQDGVSELQAAAQDGALFFFSPGDFHHPTLPSFYSPSPLLTPPCRIPAVAFQLTLPRVDWLVGQSSPGRHQLHLGVPATQGCGGASSQ
eukprot:GGOE01035572.1.p4 GENE.GGOE01035572.1~~GGOE01035572.1.p4  ORF type:complete len:100 (+),score=12.91 GGOE01035572.1:549-848(+)